MLNKRILVFIFLLVFLLLVGCIPSEPNQVPKLIGIKVSPDTITMSVGTDLQLEVDAVYDDGNHADITSDCIYSSSDSFIVIVNTYEGKVTAKAFGEAIITVTYISDGIVFTDTVEVTVRADIVEEVVI